MEFISIRRNQCHQLRSIGWKHAYIKEEIDVRSEKIGKYDQERQPVKKFPEVLMIFFGKIMSDSQKDKEGNNDAYSRHIKFRSPQDEIGIHT